MSVNAHYRAITICRNRSKITSGRDVAQRAWQSMRVMRRFTIAELKMTSEQAGKALSHSYIAAYIRLLRKHGYIRRHRNNWTVYHLIKNTGPIRPFVFVKGLFDCNTRIHWIFIEGDLKAQDVYGQEISDIEKHAQCSREANARSRGSS